MKNKMLPLPCHYILDEICLNEISLAFSHMISEWVEAKLPRFYDNKDWKEIELTTPDSKSLSEIVKGRYVILFYKTFKFDLEIRINDNLELNEILFN